MPVLERAIVIVLDGVGVGQAPDAGSYGDAGANSLSNCARAIGGLRLPHMGAMGLGNITTILGTPPVDSAGGVYGRLEETAAGKDSTTGHWELMGVTLTRPLPTYPLGFPSPLVAQFEAEIGRGVLGNRAASGTVIIEELGEEHMRTGKPILYTSADSVFQLAAHQEIIPLPQLYQMCETARRLLTGENAVGRVIARPFIGRPGSFTRTPDRRDFSLEPPAPTLLDRLKESGYEVSGIGKIADLFAGRGLTRSNHTGTNQSGMAAAEAEVERRFRGLLFVNLVDCDQLFGHRRDPLGYSAALQTVDAWLPNLEARLAPGDALFITGDHGTDPTFGGTDHTREAVPLLGGGPALPRASVNLGVRVSFADLGATLAEAFQVEALGSGTSFAGQIGLQS